jgi:hypothetical protein
METKLRPPGRPRKIEQFDHAHTVHFRVGDYMMAWLNERHRKRLNAWAGPGTPPTRADVLRAIVEDAMNADAATQRAAE